MNRYTITAGIPDTVAYLALGNAGGAEPKYIEFKNQVTVELDDAQSANLEQIIPEALAKGFRIYAGFESGKGGSNQP